MSSPGLHFLFFFGCKVSFKPNVESTTVILDAVYISINLHNLPELEFSTPVPGGTHFWTKFYCSLYSTPRPEMNELDKGDIQTV